MRKSIVTLNGYKTEILVGRGILRQKTFGEMLSKTAKRFAVITDETTERLFKERLLAHGLDCVFFAVPPGENSKTREMKQLLEDKMLAMQFGRDAAVIALGGGVISDLAGFVAATYMRGVPLVVIPTTLLAMCDGSIGGKTAVNTPYGKNLIGAFHPSAQIFMEIECLDTLPERERRAGMAEVIKHALILDPTILEVEDWEELVWRNAELKMRVVEADFRDNKERHLLNFGHTVGHALERLENYRLLHGEAVAIGMLLESLMSVELGYLKEESFARILQIMQQHQFPLEIAPRITAQELMWAMQHDKKGLRFVVLKEIGQALDCCDVQLEILEKAMQKYVAYIGQTQPV